jgi:hypothetical protein
MQGPFILRGSLHHAGLHLTALFASDLQDADKKIFFLKLVSSTVQVPFILQVPCIMHVDIVGSL